MYEWLMQPEEILTRLEELGRAKLSSKEEYIARQIRNCIQEELARGVQFVCTVTRMESVCISKKYHESVGEHLADNISYTERLVLGERQRKMGIRASFLLLSGLRERGISEKELRYFLWLCMEKLVNLNEEKAEIVGETPKDWGQGHRSFYMYLFEAWWEKEAAKNGGMARKAP